MVGMLNDFLMGGYGAFGSLGNLGQQPAWSQWTQPQAPVPGVAPAAVPSAAKAATTATPTAAEVPPGPGGFTPGAFGKNIVNYLQNNPQTIMALASGLISGPGTKGALAKGFAALGPGMAADKKTNKEEARRKALTQLMKNPAFAQALGPERLALLQDPELAEAAMPEMFKYIFDTTGTSGGSQEGAFGTPQIEVDPETNEMVGYYQGTTKGGIIHYGKKEDGSFGVVGYEPGPLSGQPGSQRTGFGATGGGFGGQPGGSPVSGVPATNTPAPTQTAAAAPRATTVQPQAAIKQVQTTGGTQLTSSTGANRGFTPDDKSVASQQQALGTSAAAARQGLPTLENLVRRVDEVATNLLKPDSHLDSYIGRYEPLGLPKQGFQLTPEQRAQASNVKAQIDQIIGTTFSAAFEGLKGAGAITQDEGKAATEAIARLRALEVTDADYRVALTDAQREMAKLVDVVKARIAAAGPLPAAQPPGVYTQPTLRAPSRAGAAPAALPDPGGIR